MAEAAGTTHGRMLVVLTPYLVGSAANWAKSAVRALRGGIDFQRSRPVAAAAGDAGGAVS